jgi:hypothetical protein
VTVQELRRLLDSALCNSESLVQVTLTHISDQDDLAFILKGAVDAARRWEARLNEIHLPRDRFAAAAVCPGITLFDSGDLGVVRLHYEPVAHSAKRRRVAEPRAQIF